MRRREFVALLGCAAAWPLGVHAQQPTRRIGMLIGYAENDPAGFCFSTHTIFLYFLCYFFNLHLDNFSPGSRGHLPRLRCGVAHCQCWPCEPRSVEGDERYRELPDRSSRWPRRSM
jgi:hypothetical protein